MPPSFGSQVHSSSGSSQLALYLVQHDRALLEHTCVTRTGGSPANQEILSVHRAVNVLNSYNNSLFTAQNHESLISTPLSPIS